MIRYALKCADGHAFDSWFQSADAYDGLAAKGLVTCAICGGSGVTKAIMSPRVSSGGAPGATDAPAPAAAPDTPKPVAAGAPPMIEALKAFRRFMEKNSTYVGRGFAAEARAIHDGEKPDRLIHGEADAAEVRALMEEGIDVAPLPFLPREKAN